MVYIRRNDLISHNVHYEPNVYQVNQASAQQTAHVLPDHIETVRHGLLSLKNILPRDCQETLRKELARHGSEDIGPEWCLFPPQSAFVDNRHSEVLLQQSAAHSTLNDCEEVVRLAHNTLVEAEGGIGGWEDFFKHNIFKLFRHEAREQSGLK